MTINQDSKKHHVNMSITLITILGNIMKAGRKNSLQKFNTVNEE